ncbi:MAG: thiamine diphosphokinase, partial [Spirochaetota bacterium]
MNALVITGGAYPDLEAVRHLVDSAGFIVAADSGLETAIAYGIRPSIVVGDFDSLSDEGLLAEYDDASVRRFSTAKDLTDTELALRVAREEGCERVHLVGGGGGRVDHLLAIAGLFERDRYPDLWVTDTSVIRAFDSELV